MYNILGDYVIKCLEILLVICCGMTITSISKENSEDIIYIDPGHGGIDGGCEAADGTKEKDINLFISLALRDELETMGYVVKVTRAGDYDLANKSSTNHKRDDMERRCELLNQSNLFVSIHANEYSDSNTKGAQVFYYGSKNKQLASCIQNVLKEMIGTNRQELEIKEKYLLINTKTQGCIVEVGFLSNQEELQLLKNSDYQRKIANAIAIGIVSYLND